ncbi:DUF5777 family beta-barrel protein [Foetidibacter luteolus]|uniref:DUF5777 family beta-barrel protein n=1 Tax=Foetidibacter luteolus TaxID=2608880 RepID=UPI00129BD3A4|nr:DUF5777 family beta-barrel protein [Foetidibacter luteolus]
MKLFISTLVFSFLIFSQALAQDVDLDKMLDETTQKKDTSVKLTDDTFLSTRLIDGHTVETTQAGVLDFRISHRFGTLNQGIYDLFGLDNASMRMSFDYGFTDRFTAGLGRSTFEKQYDGFVKYRLLHQSEGKKSMPLSVTLVASMIIKTLKDQEGVKSKNTDRYYYAYQVLLARKFSEAFSLQLMPTMIHYNMVPAANLNNNFFSVGAGTRIKLSKRFSLNAEYYYQLPGNKIEGAYNALSIGFDIVTAGHVFQLHFTNSTGMTERTVITETTGRWGKGDIHFGFNVSRVFTIKKPKPAAL